jgi:hypothetical protein
MLTLLGLAVFVGVVGGSLWLVMGRIHSRAKAIRVSPIGPLLLGLLGYMVGTVAMDYAAISLITWVYPSSWQTGWPIFAMLTLSSVMGATVGAAFGYVCLWARTTRDPDYGPPDPDAVDERSWPPKRKPR